MSWTSANLSILGLPIYWGLALLPKFYATNLASQGNPASVDNRNPKGTDYRPRLAQRLGPSLYTRWERAEAAHGNMLENFPLFAAAVIAGNLANLDGVDTFVQVYLALRVVYVVSYITTTTNSYSYIRTGLWFSSVIIAFRTLTQAAFALGK
ncbi:hypothetical protein M501DRAFT_998491 [Patellaria atrata CBS 101060]|uniref:MAPEG family protein n=1 Tax=Patellaria atrata CBS 101060 TaxID=1346257 RepID=A0A9P4VW10_9PEZI|nr:hypothetical protein M501DRAFT_998491 [Patellaria atrata CBS 101060]